MKLAIRNYFLFLFVRLGILPADSLLLYNDDAFIWNSGFGSFAYICYSLVRSANPDVVVEIGASFGRSTCYIAAALQRNGKGKLYSIDPHETTKWNDNNHTNTYIDLSSRLKTLRLSSYVEIYQQYSNHASKNWHKPIDLLLIDGSHTYDDVKEDFYNFLPFLKQDALILFHDTMWGYYQKHSLFRSDQGVPRLMQELQNAGYPMVTLKEGWGLTILQNNKNGFSFNLWTK